MNWLQVLGASCMAASTAFLVPLAKGGVCGMGLLTDAGSKRKTETAMDYGLWTVI